MAATGFAWLVAAAGFSDLPLVFTLGQVFGALFFAVVCHLLLAFPSGRLQSLAERRIVAAAYVLTTVGVAPLWLFADPQQLDCDDCPDNVMLDRTRTSRSSRRSRTILNLFGALLVAAVLVVLVKRWRRATPAQRRFLVPVYSAGVAVLLLLIVLVVLQAGGLARQGARRRSGWPRWCRSRSCPTCSSARSCALGMIQSGAVGELMARLGETPQRGELRDALARALGDPSLELVYWLPDDERFVDARRPRRRAARRRARAGR